MAYLTATDLLPGHARNYERYARQGDVESCWQWTGPHDRYGYAASSAKANGVRQGTGAHRVGYLLFRGPIPAGLVLDHTCMNRWCVNPWHLEAVTNHANTLRQRRAGMCRTGRHELTDENALWTPDGRHRRCRECMREVNRRGTAKYRAKIRAARQAA